MLVLGSSAGKSSVSFGCHLGDALLAGTCRPFMLQMPPFLIVRFFFRCIVSGSFRLTKIWAPLGTHFSKKIIPLFRTNVQNTIHNKKKHVSPRIMTPPVCDSPSASQHSASIAFEASNCWSLLVAQKLPAFLLKTCCARPDSLEVLHLPRPCKLIFYALLASEIAHFL